MTLSMHACIAFHQPLNPWVSLMRRSRQTWQRDLRRDYRIELFSAPRKGCAQHSMQLESCAGCERWRRSSLAKCPISKRSRDTLRRSQLGGDACSQILAERAHHVRVRVAYFTRVADACWSLISSVCLKAFCCQSIAWKFFDFYEIFLVMSFVIASHFSTLLVYCVVILLVESVLNQ